MWYKISTAGSLDYSQSTRVTDGQTDGRRDGQRDGQNYDSQDRASIAASRGKNHFFYEREVERLHAKFHLNVFIMLASAGQKPQF